MCLATSIGTVPVYIAITLAALVALAAIWGIPRYQARGWRAQGIDGKDLADVQNASRTTIVQTIGGLALLATFAVTWVQIADARRASDRTLKATQQGLLNDQFTRAVAELGAARPSGLPQLEVRVGGIYSLYRVGIDSPRARRTIDQILIAYLHGNAARKERDPLAGEVGVRASACARNWAIPKADAQAALRVVLDFPASQGYADYRDLGLAGITASGGDFRTSLLTNVDLAGAKLQRARFDASSVDLADLRAACLVGATFVLTNLAGSDLRNADLRGSDLHRANLNGADMRGADASTAKGLTRKQLREAVIDACTRLPWKPEHGSCPDPLPPLQRAKIPRH